MSILLFVLLTNKSNLFLIEFVFNGAHITLFTFLSLWFLRISFQSSVWQIQLILYSEFHSYDSFLFKSRDIDVFKLVFCCWCQFSFTRNLEKFSAKILIPLLFKYNLLLFTYLLGSIPSSCERSKIFLSLQISTRWRLTSFASFKSSSHGNNTRHSYSVTIIFQRHR